MIHMGVFSHSPFLQRVEEERLLQAELSRRELARNLTSRRQVLQLDSSGEESNEECSSTVSSVSETDQDGADVSAEEEGGEDDGTGVDEMSSLRAREMKEEDGGRLSTHTTRKVGAGDGSTVSLKGSVHDAAAGAAQRREFVQQLQDQFQQRKLQSLQQQEVCSRVLALCLCFVSFSSMLSHHHATGRPFWKN